MLTWRTLGGIHLMFKETQEMLYTKEGQVKYVFNNPEINLIFLGLLKAYTPKIPDLYIWNFQLVGSGEGLSLSDRCIFSMIATDMVASGQKNYIYGLLGLDEHNITIDYSKNLSLSSLYGQFISCFFKDWPKLSSVSDDAWSRKRMVSILNYAGLHIHSIFGEDEERLPT
jgi:hypothetical protein